MLSTAVGSLIEPGSPSRVVLDTNVILALWWFEDPALNALRRAVSSGSLPWMLGTDGEAELRHVMQRRLTAGDPVNRTAEVLHWVDLRAVRLDPAPPQLHLRCTDADDQKFIDLAYHLRDAALLSRDRAVLRLRRQAARRGLTILPPESWPAGADSGDAVAASSCSLKHL